MQLWSYVNGANYNRLWFASGGLVINESGINSYTRIEGSNDQNLVYVDAANDRVGIGTSSPSQLLDVDGNLNVNGTVTKPNHPAFLVKKGGANQNDFQVSAYTTVIYDGTEYFDQDSNFASNTFTAPVTGKYQFNYYLRLQSLDIDTSYYILVLKTSNRSYTNIISPNSFAADVQYFPFPFAILTDMDANDTVYIQIYAYGGASQLDVSANSWFSGYLVA